MSALLSNPTVREASEATGVPETTIYNWLRKPDFRQEYDSRRRQLVDSVSTHLQVRLTDAAGTVLEIMEDNKTPAQTRLNAARTVLEYCHKFTEQRDILDRLDVLEAATMEGTGR